MIKKPVAPRPPPDSRPKNYLLKALPAADFARLSPDLTTIPTPTRTVFHKHGKPIDHVYFPNGGVASVTAVLSDGTMVETATVGLEGMIGLEAFFGKEPVAAGQTMMQVPNGSAEKLGVAAFRRELGRQGALHEIIGRYAQAAVALIMQSTACNARHHVQERCPRWLLLTHDRVGQDTFELSQDFLGMMLGVRRQTVTVVAGTLQRAGLISYRHGRITVLDRKGLEAAACECYGLSREQFDTLRG